MKHQIVCINGVCQSGKDTFVAICQEILGTNKVWNYSSIDKVKEIAMACGWDGNKTPAARKFLSDLKDLTEEFCEMPYNAMCDKIQAWDSTSASSDAVEILFLHIREPEQIKRIQDEFRDKGYNIHSMLVTRAGHDPEISNHADANVYNYTYDYHIRNDGSLEQLKTVAKDWIDTFVYETWRKDINDLFFDADYSF